MRGGVKVREVEVRVVEEVNDLGHILAQVAVVALVLAPVVQAVLQEVHHHTHPLHLLLHHHSPRLVVTVAEVTQVGQVDLPHPPLFQEGVDEEKVVMTTKTIT